VNDTPKRFEEWEEVDCNECARYWDSSCDGTSKGSKKGCNSYLPTRSVVIPAQIKALQTDIIALKVGCGICIIALAIGLLATRLGWF
jgi:hypothetical protein